ncbi:MAG: CDP-alcohol phosphatidyltransferase family protein [Verrucomicrobiales bacterium]
MASSDPERKTPKIYLLPNLMTAGNLACGFWAIVKIFEGMRNPDGGTNPYYIAIASILGACLFDSLDGRIARIKGQESLFGREFDSIADIVSFGLAPALLVMDIVLRDFDARLGWTIAFIYLLCGGMRLARFNCLAAMNPGSSSKDFVGFPIPAAAGLIASLTVFIFWLNEGEREIGMWKLLSPSPNVGFVGTDAERMQLSEFQKAGLASPGITVLGVYGRFDRDHGGPLLGSGPGLSLYGLFDLWFDQALDFEVLAKRN